MYENENKLENNELEEKGQEDLDSRAKSAIQFMSDVIGTSFERALKTLNSQNKMENVAIFVDYDNVYWTLMNYYSHDPDDIDPEKNLFLRLWERYGQNNVRTFRVYADFQLIRTSLTSLQKKRIQIRHVYSNDKKGDQRKNSSDIELSIDAIESTYKDPNITCYVIVTADSDMIPILSRLRYKGKRVELFYLSKAAPRHIDMTSFADYSQDLLEFLNLEVKEINLDDYIVPALNFIYQWEQKYKDNNEYYLGKRYLRDSLVSQLGIPSNTCSELIEKLDVEQYICTVNKKYKDEGYKPSISLTEKGNEVIMGYIEAASASENE